ncbi:HEAT repeat domain-containing protein [Sphingomonas sp. GB1N7]|uniref:HEAT repeat domain-containing protein n=1 Tax=Parasphingomonas caseinilytica TaxID=3096158 RepID=UPI002FC8D09B
MADDQEPYRPASDFLMLLIDEAITLTGIFGAANLAQLIGLTRDEDMSNRDWAVFLLSQSEADSPAVRQALRDALQDSEDKVRLEAIIGIAKREPAFALPLVVALLEQTWIDSMAIEAASYVADPSLLPLLEAIKRDTPDWDDGMFGIAMRDAIESCTSGIQPEWRNFSD